MAFGPPLAGKTTLVAAFTRAMGGRIGSYEMASTRAPSPEQRVVRGLVSIDGAATQLITVPGAAFGGPADFAPLLDGAAAVALVLDSQAARGDENDAYVAFLDGLADAPALGCVVFTKRDLVGRSPTLEPRPLLGTRFAEWPMFTTRLDQPHSLPQPIEWLARGASSSKLRSP